MKNEQSLPNSSAYYINCLTVRPRLKSLFKIFNTKAASALPPPRPAPNGTALCKCIFINGSFGNFLRSNLYAFTQILDVAIPGTENPLVVNGIPRLLEGSLF